MKNYNRPMLYRLYTIHNIIANGGYPNCTDFKRRLEVSLPTINRDIDALRYDFNAPIEYSREKNGYFYAEEFELPSKPNWKRDLRQFNIDYNNTKNQ